MNYPDFAAIANLGKPQFTSREAQRLIADARKHAQSTGDVTFAGQSMGGLLAQATAYMAQSKLDKRAAGKVSLTTWGAVGGRELIDNLLAEQDKTFDPDVMRKIDAVGFYVDGDPYTRIGTHMEPTRLLPRPRNVSPSDGHFIEKGILPSIQNAPDGLGSALSRTPERDEALTRILKRNLNTRPMSEPMGMARNEAAPAPERRTAVAFQPDNGGSETGGMLGDSMLVDPKYLSLDNKDRVRARLGFHAEDAGPEKFVARLEDDPGFGFGGGGSRPSRAGRSLLDA